VEFLPGIDGRTLMARRWQELATNLIVDQGGEESCSTTKLILLKRLAATAAMLEELEARYISSDPIDIDKYISLSQLAARLANTIGLARKAKSVPDLGEYINGRRSRVIEHDDAEDD
jgi:hypothetical protein